LNNKEVRNSFDPSKVVDYTMDIKFDFVYIKNPEPSSIYSAFDFVHGLKTNNEFKKINRFVTLLPQLGVFHTDTANMVATKEVADVFISRYRLHEASIAHYNICIIELNLVSALGLDASKGSS